MGLDPELVRQAERAKEHLAVSQHAAYRAKVNYHQAIRRLHAAGGSLLEIAKALRLSHQRVHQISTRPPSRPGGGGGVDNHHGCRGRWGRARSVAAHATCAPS